MLSLLVFVHELGHFLVARACGIKVEEFGFGFPPKVFGIKKGDTVYSVNWIPIGGFVRIKGENGNDRLDSDSFASKKVWQRFLVLVAGVSMNFVLAVILFSVGFMVGFPSIIDSDLPAKAHVSDSRFSVMQVLTDSPAAQAGIVMGDAILSINGEEVGDAGDARIYLAEHGINGVDLKIQKENKQIVSLHVVAQQLQGMDKVGIGVAFAKTGLVSYPFYLAIPEGVAMTINLTRDIIFSLFTILKNLIVTQKAGVDLAGPVGIAVMTGQAVTMGFVYVIQFAALLSVNLAVINILPFPALDGGRIIFLLFEKLRGRSASQRVETVAHNLGFLFLMILVVLVTAKDVIHLFK